MNVILDPRLYGTKQLLAANNAVYVLAPDAHVISRVTESGGIWGIRQATADLGAPPAAILADSTQVYAVLAAQLLAFSAAALAPVWAVAGSFGECLALSPTQLVAAGSRGGQVFQYSLAGALLSVGYLPLTEVKTLAYIGSGYFLATDNVGNVVRFSIRVDGWFQVWDTFHIPNLVGIRSQRLYGAELAYVVSGHAEGGAVVLVDISSPAAPVFSAPNSAGDSYIINSFQQGTPATDLYAGQIPSPWWYKSSDALLYAAAWPAARQGQFGVDPNAGIGSFETIIDLSIGFAPTIYVLPLDPSQTYNFRVDWGDGNVQTVTNATPGFPNILHTYAAGTVCTLRAVGTIPNNGAIDAFHPVTGVTNDYAHQFGIPFWLGAATLTYAPVAA